MSDHPLVDWLRDSEPGPLDDPPPGRRSRHAWATLAVLAGLWVGLLAVAWQVLGAPAAEPPLAAPEQPAQASSGPPVPASSGPPVPASSGPPVPASSGPPVPASSGPPVPAAPEPPARGPVDERVVAAHAVLAVRVRAQAAEGPRRYADLVVAEEVRWMDDAAIVMVLAHLLEGDEHRWSSARTARYGVALSLEGRALTTEAVWPLPAPELGAPRDWDAVADSAVAEAARGSLAAAGYRDIGDIGLAVHPQLPGVLRVTVDATAPGERQTGTHAVWLDRAAAVVLGWSG